MAWDRVAAKDWVFGINSLKDMVFFFLGLVFGGAVFLSLGLGPAFERAVLLSLGLAFEGPAFGGVVFLSSGPALGVVVFSALTILTRLSVMR